ncbi:Lon protease C-terminal proteolytic domain-domain-containing protein [Kockovaella imperatae]|uniref:Lon protease homolog, mitochondrial n=1 Tax=Kockovaella imperatae TaxID=4999 RepID=A0A1Y1UIJ0_9TREE|nr:Lon protease C-terminal proteolytic domain-domain-containing protein [Kockovaella imperatae]ORX37316.1 Lon protease C-terminal proteolytic domain-domain-containing protein [Kockovaella imperatae]
MLPLRSSRAAVQRRRLSTIASSSSATRSPSSIRLRPQLPPSLPSSSHLTPIIPIRHLHTSNVLLKTKVGSKADGEGEEAAEDEGKDSGVGKAKEGTKPKRTRAESSSRKKATLKEEQNEEAVEETEAESSQAAEKRAKSESRSEPEPASTSSTSAQGAAMSASAESSSSSSNDNTPPRTGREIARPDVPEIYPQLLALPLTQRPLFPSFYKAVTIHNPAVIKAVKQLVARGQPYLGAFLLKEADVDADVITSMDQVHPVGIFAQITSFFEANVKTKSASKLTTLNDESEKDASGAKDEKETTSPLTVILFPLRRIRLDELVDQNLVKIGAGVEGESEGRPEPRPAEIVQKDESEVASFEKGVVPSVQDVKERIGKKNPSSEGEDKPSTTYSQIGFLHHLVPEVSLANVSNFVFDNQAKDTQMVKALVNELITIFKDLAQMQSIFREQITSFTTSNRSQSVFEEPDRLADFAAAVTTGEAAELQAVVESPNIEDRLQKALELLKKELINAQLQQKIARDVDSKIQKRQREYYLMEQMKGIKKELGLESDGKDKLLEKFREKAAKLAMPEGVRKIVDEELNKLSGLEQVSSEFAVTRNYLDWLTDIPWGLHSTENFDIERARRILDDDHYGMKDVKDRILEFLAIGKLKGSVQGKIVCLSGPPGVGKTSVGKSIAKALDRQFYRFSVGGLNDMAEIKGHRRTYVGAMPGKAVQALKKVQVENPLILIDEIDKIGNGRFNGGDPQGAILEMLDPEQNSSFVDHYLDVPIDLSRVLFVCTANYLPNIPRPLLDRLEVIELSGYVAEEKKVIAERYLAPTAKESSGLQDVTVDIKPEALDNIVKWYARESGVRNLKKLIEKIYRKVAFKIVTEHGDKLAEAPAEETEAASITTVESQDPDVKPASERLPVDEASKDGEEKSVKPVTTTPRPRVQVPDGIKVEITPENLRDYIGSPVYPREKIYANYLPAGVSTGLAASGEGLGWVLPIEVNVMPGKGGLRLTGKLGEVMQESSHLAISWVKAHAFALGIADSDDKIILSDKDLHLHFPEGATGKDGPSAGSAIVTALVSLLTKTKVSQEIALTGEISLHGQVLPVGGLKEKTLAAHRAGIKKILVPAANKVNIQDDVHETVKEGIEFVYVENLNQVLREVFAGEATAEKWKETLPIDKEPERVKH